MSLKFQTTKWEVEITWEQLTVTPLEAAGGHMPRTSEETNEGGERDTANIFLFDLIGQMFGSTQK